MTNLFQIKDLANVRKNSRCSEGKYVAYDVSI
jgi:hypothetical protein